MGRKTEGAAHQAHHGHLPAVGRWVCAGIQWRSSRCNGKDPGAQRADQRLGRRRYLRANELTVLALARVLCQAWAGVVSSAAPGGSSILARGLHWGTGIPVLEWRQHG